MRSHKAMSPTIAGLAYLLSAIVVSSLVCLSPNSNALVHAQQAATATLSGSIRDPNGALVQGASVVARQKATGVGRSTTTNTDGVFVLTNLPADEYEVKIQSKGFATTTVNVTLRVGQNETLNTALRIENAKVGDVTVSDSLAAISTETSVVDGVVGRREIEGLPLNGRNFLELALLIPGNSPAPNFDPTKSNTVVISSAGQLGRGRPVVREREESRSRLAQNV